MRTKRICRVILLLMLILSVLTGNCWAALRDNIDYIFQSDTEDTDKVTVSNKRALLIADAGVKAPAVAPVNRPLSSRQMKKEKLRHEGLVPVSKGSQAL